MTVAVSGDSITFNDNSKQTSAQVGMKNKIINGVFILNQRGYVSGTSLASGAYGHDRFKAGASGCTYTFTQAALGVPTTITITAGSLIQIIEGCNVPEGGAYVLSWTGSAQARLNGGAYGASGTVVVSSWVAGTNLPVEFSTGTVSSVQLEKGSTASTYDFRDYGRELMMCQRYALADTNASSPYRPFGNGNVANTTQGYVVRQFPVPMRTTPSVTASAGNVFLADTGATATATIAVSDNGFGTPMLSRVAVTTTSGLTAGTSLVLVSDGLYLLRTITYSAEL